MTHSSRSISAQLKTSANKGNGYEVSVCLYTNDSFHMFMGFSHSSIPKDTGKAEIIIEV